MLYILVCHWLVTSNPESNELVLKQYYMTQFCIPAWIVWMHLVCIVMVELFFQANGDMALHICCRRKDVDMAKVLVEFGVNPDSQNVRNSHTPSQRTSKTHANGFSSVDLSCFSSHCPAASTHFRWASIGVKMTLSNHEHQGKTGILIQPHVIIKLNKLV